MAKINQLDKSVYELIAAGEVIERPASVIKELAENSIDAGAGTITVEIRRGGITYMRVTDDGCGISYEDMPVAFQRHATSKVRIEDDLDHINTLGFRGEALASVCAVARVEAESRRSEDELGTRYSIEGISPLSYEKVGCAAGTSIIIRDLFFNTPARLKFLKKDVTEGNYCANVIEKLALSHPDISFRFIRDGKQTLFTSGDGQYYSAIRSIFGKQFAASMIPVENIFREISVMGYVSSPLFTKSNRVMQNFFVNGRSVKSPVCCAALEEAFRNSIMVGKFPACVLCINLDPTDLDANISPTKTEVRFSNEKLIFDAIYMAVKNGLTGYDESREIKLQGINTEEDVAASVTVPVKNELYSVPRPAPDRESFFRKNEPFRFSENQPEGEQQVLPEILPPTVNIEKTVNGTADCKADDSSEGENDLSGYSFLSEQSFAKPEKTPVGEAESTVVTEKAEEEEITDIRVIGELFKTYILCESESSLLLIDKHAAHERINFERFRKGVDIHGQMLLEPRQVFLPAAEFEAVRSFKEKLEGVGFILRIENDKLFVEGLPQSLEFEDPEDLLQSVAEILARGNDNAEGVLFDDVLHTMACKASVRGGENQTPAELAYLAKRVINDRNIRYCPHGRPVITQITRRQIEKYFGRVV